MNFRVLALALTCLVIRLPAPAAPASSLAPKNEVEEKVPVVLKVNFSKKKFDADEPVDLIVTLFNTGDKPIYLQEEHGFFPAFKITVMAKGKIAIKRTAFGEEVLAPRPPTSSFGYIPPQLLPKTTLKIVFPLRRMFDLSQGGEFAVSVERDFQLNYVALPAGERREIETKFAGFSGLSVAHPPDITMETSPSTNTLYPNSSF